MRFRLSSITAFAAACVIATPTPAHADWPEFHGPRRDNISPETGLLKKWPAAGPQLLWEAEGLGAGYASVSIAGGTIYTAGQLGDTTHVIALDMAGGLKWKAPNGRSWKASPKQRHAVRYGGSRSTPTVHEGVAYHMGELGRVAAFDAETGRELWAVDIMARFAGKLPKYGYCESLLIDGEKLFCYCGGPKVSMVALNRKTGEAIWQGPPLKDGTSCCSPIIAEFAGVRQLVSMNGAAIVSYDIASGELLWRYEHDNTRDNNITSPIFHDGCIFATTGYGKGCVGLRLKAERGKVRVERLWETKAFDNHHGGVVLLDGYVYGTGQRSRGWHCMDIKTGELKYRDRGFGKGAVTYADGLLYCVAERGLAGLAKPTPAGFELVNSFQLPKKAKDFFWAHPVVHDGRLYIRHAGYLYAYDVRGK